MLLLLVLLVMLMSLLLVVWWVVYFIRGLNSVFPVTHGWPCLPIQRLTLLAALNTLLMSNHRGM
jgi:hypothetical protein